MVTFVFFLDVMLHYRSSRYIRYVPGTYILYKRHLLHPWTFTLLCSFLACITFCIGIWKTGSGSGKIIPHPQQCFPVPSPTPTQKIPYLECAETGPNFLKGSKCFCFHWPTWSWKSKLTWKFLKTSPWQRKHGQWPVSGTQILWCSTFSWISVTVYWARRKK